MEIDQRDRIGSVPGRGGLSGFTYVIFGLIFLAMTFAAFFGTTGDAVRGTLVSIGVFKREDFSAVYRRLGVSPLPVETEAASAVSPSLERLTREPCASRAIFALSDALVKIHEEGSAADALVGWSAGCAPDNASELRRAASLFIDLHNYAKARSISADLLAVHPAVSDYWYLNGKADVGLHTYDDALLSYANTIHLAPNPQVVGRWVFNEMSDIYVASHRFCEAIGPLQDYVSFNPSERATAQMQQIIEAYAGKGHCTDFASGAGTFPVSDANVIRTRVTINGVSGTFIVDTGASFVVVSKTFAAKARLEANAPGSIRAITANGAIYAKLASAATVKVGRYRTRPWAKSTVFSGARSYRGSI